MFVCTILHNAAFSESVLRSGGSQLIAALSSRSQHIVSSLHELCRLYSLFLSLQNSGQKVTINHTFLIIFI